MALDQILLSVTVLKGEICTRGSRFLPVLGYFFDSSLWNTGLFFYRAIFEISPGPFLLVLIFVLQLKGSDLTVFCRPAVFDIKNWARSGFSLTFLLQVTQKFISVCCPPGLTDLHVVIADSMLPSFGLTASWLLNVHSYSSAIHYDKTH